MKNIPIIGKIMLILGLFAVFVALVAVYATGRMRHIDRGYTDLMKGNDRAGLYLARASRSFQETRDGVAEITIARSSAGNVIAEGILNEGKSSFLTFMDMAARASPAHAATIDALKTQALSVLTNDCTKAIALSEAATSVQALLASQMEFQVNCSPQFPLVTAAISQEVAAITAETDAGAARLAVETGATIRATYGGIIGGLVLVGLLGFFGTRSWVIVPLKAQLGTMRLLADGNYSVAIADADRRDELGAMARAVQVFKDNGLEKLRLEAAAEADRVRAQAERERQQAERDAIAREQARVVDSLALGLEKFSGGDLAFRLRQSFSAEYEALRGDFNAAVGKLQETIRVIARTTESVRSAAAEITQASDDLSRRTEQQAASLEQTAAALDQITATVGRTADVAREARTLVDAARTDADRAGDILRETVGAMDGIEASSKRIGTIISVIDEIAFQTNLLALNAGVEAARAGDAGRGFAVVATEVRALAQRSADAAKEIKGLISASGTQVDSGVRLVSETGTSLGRIVDQVVRLNTLVTEIAASAQEQATGLHQVNAAVSQMDQVTQQNAAMVEQATAASRSLADEAETLVQQVGQFRINETSNVLMTA